MDEEQKNEKQGKVNNAGPGASFLFSGCLPTTYEDYFSQPPPPEEPGVFALGGISTDRSEYPPTFNRDLTTFFYGDMDGEGKRQIYIVERDQGGLWQLPEVMDLTGLGVMEPVFSPSGQRLYFSSETSSMKGKPNDIYYIERTESGWSDPESMPDPVNSAYKEYNLSETHSGRVYFTREGVGILRSHVTETGYSEPEAIASLAGYTYASHPFVAPDESYLIFDSTKAGGQGSADLYIAFIENGLVGQPINLGTTINSGDWDAMPQVSPDGRVLFFVRENSQGRDIYWVKFDVEAYR